MRLLRSRGVEAENVPDPERALTLLEPGVWSLLVIDYELGGGWTGSRFAREARPLLGTPCPPMVLLSGALERIDLEDRRPFSGAYSKSLAPRSLLDELFATIAEGDGRPRSQSRLRAMPRHDVGEG